MYRKEYQVVPWGKRSSAGSGTKWGTPASIMEAGMYEELYMWIAKASSFPKYSDRGPDINVTISMPGMQLTGYGPYPTVKCTAFTIDWGKLPSTATGHYVNISQYALGAIEVKADLALGSGTTARATYGITVIGKGYS